MKIKCITLFDITKTNVSNRRQLLEHLPFNEKQRKQQSNFETLLQIISLRSQPENISEPIHTSIDFDLWGSAYRFKKSSNAWTFDFTVNQNSTYKNNEDDLHYLKLDCDGVPMAIDLDESTALISTLSFSDEHKNIHFEVSNEK